MLLTSLVLAALAPPPQDAAGGAAAAAARPRVGLVLSSGGAHTLAHAGAIAALEELRVPVDFVSGSEGGAVIGGLYASGLTPAELRQLLWSRPWVDALSGKVSRPLLSWRQRSVDRDFLLTLPISFGPGHLGLSRGLARTRWLSWLLTSSTLPAAGARSFDELPIPFRAAATDLLAGGEVELSAGDLPSALMASFATPGLYAPVEVDGRELGSGALSDPLPVAAALAAGCDALVVVDCALELGQRERLDSFLLVQRHVGVLAGEAQRRAALARLRPGDVRVEPDPGAADEQDFRSADGAWERGRDAVLARAEALAPLALDAAAWQRHLDARRARRPALPRLAQVRFEDQSGLSDVVLRARVESRPGAPLEARAVSEDLLRLYGLDYHERIDVALEPRPGGDADLVFRTHDAADDLWNPRAGAALEGVFGEDATFVLGAAATFRPVGPLGAEWRNRVEVGSRILLYSEFWQPIDPTARWFVAPAVGYEQQRVNVTLEEDVLAVLDVWAVGARVDLGRVLGEWGEFRVGLTRQSGRTSLAIGDPSLPADSSFEEGTVDTRLTMDTVDSLALPREGTIGRAQWTTPVGWLGGGSGNCLLSQVDHAMTWDRTTLVLGAEFDSALDDEDALQNAFPLGGFLRLSGLGRDSVSGAHVGLARAISWVELGQRGLDRRLVGWNLGASLEAGQTWARREDIALSDLRMSGSVFVAADTLFGAVYLGVGLTEPGQTAVFLVFGNLFGNWGPF
jgi:NTE family protein